MLYYGSFFFFPHKSRIKMTHLMSGSPTKDVPSYGRIITFFLSSAQELYKDVPSYVRLPTKDVSSYSRIIFFLPSESFKDAPSYVRLPTKDVPSYGRIITFFVLSAQESYKDVPSYVWLPTKDVPSYGRIIFSFHQSHIKMSHLMARSLYILFFLHTRVL